MKCYLLIAVIFVVSVGHVLSQGAKKSRCLSKPKLQDTVDHYIEACKNEVKTSLIEEQYFGGSEDEGPNPYRYYVEDEGKNPHPYEHLKSKQQSVQDDEDEYVFHPPEPSTNTNPLTTLFNLNRRAKRQLFGRNQYQDVDNDEKKLAGCILQCIYRKNNAVDAHGMPTLNGLTDLYTDGINEQKFFVATLKSVDKCLKGSVAKYSYTKPDSCLVSYDIFDCVSDSMTEYCAGP